VNQQAVAELEQILEQKRFIWSRDVKIAGGWVCKKCGELDRELLESHHIKPKDLFPELQYIVTNGECICLWCHAIAHQNNRIICNQILARLAIKLYYRLYPNKRTPRWECPMTDFQIAKEALNGSSHSPDR